MWNVEDFDLLMYRQIDSMLNGVEDHASVHVPARVSFQHFVDMFVIAKTHGPTYSVRFISQIAEWRPHNRSKALSRLTSILAM